MVGDSSVSAPVDLRDSPSFDREFNTFNIANLYFYGESERALNRVLKRDATTS